MFCCCFKNKDLRQQPVEAMLTDKKQAQISLVSSSPSPFPSPESNPTRQATLRSDRASSKQSSGCEEVLQFERFEDNSRVLSFKYEGQERAVMAYFIRKVQMKAPAAKNSRMTMLRSTDLMLFDFYGRRNQNSLLALLCQRLNDSATALRLEKYCPLVLLVDIPNPTKRSPKKSSDLRSPRKRQQHTEAIAKESLRASFLSEGERTVAEEVRASTLGSLRLDAIDKVLVLPARLESGSIQGIDKRIVSWVKQVLQSVQSLGSVQIYLPRSSRLHQVTEVLSGRASQSLTLEQLLGDMHFEIDCLYVEDRLEGLLISKASSFDSELTLIALTQNLLLIEYAQESSYLFGRVVPRLRKFTFTRYCKIRNEIRYALEEQNLRVRREIANAVLRILVVEKLLTEEELTTCAESLSHFSVELPCFSGTSEFRVGIELRKNYTIEVGTLISEEGTSPALQTSIERGEEKLVWPADSFQEQFLQE